MSHDDSVNAQSGVAGGAEIQDWMYGSAPSAGGNPPLRTADGPRRPPITSVRELLGTRTHPEYKCEIEMENGQLEPCVVHRPTLHHMRKWPCLIRSSTLIERVCEHGCGHPDPDSLAYFMKYYPKQRLDVHGCCGCCAPPAKGLGHGSNIPVTPEEEEYWAAHSDESLELAELTYMSFNELPETDEDYL